MLTNPSIAFFEFVILVSQALLIKIIKEDRS